MVGVPRSRGCLLCVRRRVRCDEGRPGCAKCATYGADCPGYDRSLKFVSGKHQVRKRGQGTGKDGDVMVFDTAAPSGSGSASASQSASASPRPENSSSNIDFGTGYIENYGSANSASNIIVPLFVELTAAAYGVPGPFSSFSSPPSSTITIPPHLRDNRSAYVNTILEMINMDRAPKEGLFYGSWFRQVPSRLGRKVTLDSAVCSFAMHLLGKSRGDENLVVQSRQLYGQSLVALQAALNHPTEWRSSETLCTTMVMCLFELFADTSGKSNGWLQHSSAVASLMQHRGSDGFVEAWDRAMLFSFRSVIIMNAFFTGKDCFLAKKKWQRLLSSKLAGVTVPLNEAFPAEAVSIIDRHVAHLARLPNIMHHGWAIRETRHHGLPVDQAQVSMLRRNAANLHATFRSWYAEAAPFLGNPVFREVPSNVPDDAPASPYATVLEYPNVWIASVYLSYLTSMTIIQESLNQCAAVRYETLVGQGQAEAETGAGGASGSSATMAPSTSTSGTGTATVPPTTTTATATVTGTATGTTNFNNRNDRMHDDVGSLFVPSPSTLSSSSGSSEGYGSGCGSGSLGATVDSNSGSSPTVASLAFSTDPCEALDPQLLDAPTSSARPFDACNRRLCHTIFRSFEKLGVGLMGQYRIGFSMRVSYEFADVPTQLWIRALLDRSVKTFASSSSSTYPPVEPNEFNYN